MAGRLRHWREKEGRFYARVAVPKELVSIIGKSELIEALGADRRAAARLLPVAVARLQAQISAAARQSSSTGLAHDRYGQFPLSPQQLARRLYAIRLEMDEKLRASSSNYASILIDELFAEQLRRGRAGKLRDLDLKELVGTQIEYFRDRGNLVEEFGSKEWRHIAQLLCDAELEALQRVCERDEGDFNGTPPANSIVMTEIPEEPPAPVSLRALFDDYIAARQLLGKHRDSAKGWEKAIRSLAKFLGHSDARRISKRNIIDWRDRLLAEGKSPKTISAGYLACIRAIMKWAHENDRLPSNEANAVRQPVPKKIRSREQGYTTDEAIKVLRTSIGYMPTVRDNPSNRESHHIASAKRWIPLLCAFTGARVAELAQLRKEDLRKEGPYWVIRITPDAGSVKTGAFRDVPLHRQVVALGFVEFVQSAKAGPLFHGAKAREKYLAGARATSGRISDWLNGKELVPEGVQPSHGWRHRFKTLSRELGLSDRVVDAIQGHAGKTAGDGYGDVGIIAKARVIEALPDYDL